MDVNVDRDKIKKLRKQQYLSQEELSVACGIGLRTIQRVESSGKASLETARSLASVFGVSIEDLEQTMTYRNRYFNVHNWGTRF